MKLKEHDTNPEECVQGSNTYELKAGDNKQCAVYIFTASVYVPLKC